MIKSRRLLAFLLAVIMVFFAVPAVAADDAPSVTEYNESVLAKKVALEKKYGIRIIYPQTEGKYAGIGTATLATLDTCLEYLTPELVKQISEFYREHNGVRLTIEYSHRPDFGKTESGRPVAAFTFSKSLIELFAPTDKSNSLATGSSPTAIIHEFGHAYHEYLQLNTNAEELKSLWISMNGGVKYPVKKDHDKNIFVSAYAATSYDEDFAETFAHAFVCNRAGISITRYIKDEQGNQTLLGNKIEYIEKLLKAFSPDCEQAVKNMRLLYTAPDGVTYKGLRFHGGTMEYVGYNAPYGILNSILKQMPFESQSNTWIKTIGGWHVIAKNGKEYIVFPGGNYTAAA